MWALDNRTPYAAERNWTRDKAGMHWWVVAVRATFDFQPSGRLSLADEQLPPVLAPEHYAEPGLSSLKHDSDLLAVKPSTDVLVLGHAHAPGGRAAASVPVTLLIDRLHKQLLVHGERVYHDDALAVALSAPQPFVSQPIRYESAYGGADLLDPDPSNHRIDERNPVGRGVARRSSALVGTLAHSIEYPDGAPSKTGPAGFGPVDAAWLPRRRLAGTFDERWAQTKKPLLPDDYSDDFALCAPHDQRPESPLTGGERLALLNLTREGRLVLDLPSIRLGFSTRFGRRRQEQESRLTCVCVEPELQRLSLVWQSTLRVPAADTDYLDQTAITERAAL